jgi:hypothetical protein
MSVAFSIGKSKRCKYSNLLNHKKPSFSRRVSKLLELGQEHTRTRVWLSKKMPQGSGKDSVITFSMGSKQMTKYDRNVPGAGTYEIASRVKFSYSFLIAY